MLIAFHPVDTAVMLLYLGGVLAIGFYFRREQHTSRDFFLAGRSMTWFPVGLSLVATLLSGLTYTGLPGEAYHSGLKLFILPAAIWLTAPLLIGIFLPLYRGLELHSVYEYLEYRFDSPTRLAGSVLFVVWRLLWLGGVLYAPCKLLIVAADLHVPLWVLLTATGLIATTYTFLGGMKAVIWTGVVQAFVMLAGVVAMILVAWWGLGGGPQRVWEVAAAFERTAVVDTEFRWDSLWTLWGILPHYFLAMLSFSIADQIAVQRYLTARTLKDAKKSFILNCIFVSIMTPALMYAGICLLAYYHDHPSAMRPRWVVNVDGETRKSLTYGDRDRWLGNTPAGDDVDKPLLEWSEQLDALTPASVERLVAEQRILHPNRKTPWEDARQLVDPNNPERIDLERLVTRRPPPEGFRRGEVILNEKAQDELMPWFIANRLPFGIAGLAIAGVFAATMSSLDSGLNSICTLAVMDLHRRYGWGRKWLARRVNKPVSELNEEDELRLGRPLTLVIGVAATLFSLAIAWIGDIFAIMLGIVNTFGAPLLGVFLLGIFTRRCTGRGALVALVNGTLFTTWMMLANSDASFAWLWPFDQRINSIWPVTLGTLFTIAAGYLASFFCGRRKHPQELRGLVFGCGRLGKLPSAAGR